MFFFSKAVGSLRQFALDNLGHALHAEESALNEWEVEGFNQIKQLCKRTKNGKRK